MTTSISDPVDAGLDLLTGDTARELMVSVLAASGGTLLGWSVSQVDHQPGQGTTASYGARVRWTDGSVTRERVGACSGQLPTGVARLRNGRTEIGMWRFPFDPDLPALPAACDPQLMAQVLDGAGLGAGVGAAHLRVRAYRPRRRAVIEVSARGGGTVFVKVVRPDKARRLHERHQLAAGAGVPVPAPLGWTDDGLVVLSALPGRTLRQQLAGSGPVRLDPDTVVAALDALPPRLATGRARRTWGQKAPHYAEVIAAAAPGLATRARAVASAVVHDRPDGPAVPVHGDFYESQIMVRGNRISGLLDIDTAGSGERLDDAACLLAHLAVLAEIIPHRAGEIRHLGSRLERRFARDLDRAALARRTAAVVLSLATGPHRVQEPHWQLNTERRIALAERWIDFATTSTVDQST